MVFYSAGKVPDYLNPNSNLPKQNAAGSDNRFQRFAPSPATKTGSSSRAAAIAAGANAGNRSSTSGSGSSLRVSGSNLPAGVSTGYSSRPAAIAAGVPQGNRSSTSGSGSSLRVSGANQVTSIGGPENTLATSPTGDVVPGPTTIGGPENIPDLTTPASDPGPGGGGSSVGPVPEPNVAGEAGMSQADYLAMVEDAIFGLLEGTYIDFQGSAADELRRLTNLRDQLYGNAEGQIGSVQRQQTTDFNDRRRLAAQRAASGMLQGGAYAGGQRGLGTQQQAAQAYALQELQRPFLEQVQSDRLAEFGLGYDPTGKQFDYTDVMKNMMPTYYIDENGDVKIQEGTDTSWATSTFKGRSAEANARNQALQQLLQRGITL